MTLDEINRRTAKTETLRYYPNEFELVLAQLLERWVITLEKQESRANAEYDLKYAESPY